MSGNVFGESFRIMTFGESHGKAVGVVIDGVRAGLEISEGDIQKELDRRKPGQSAVTTQRKEEDRVEILSGIFEGKTTGAPVAMLVWTRGMDSGKYERIKNLFRPGQADFAYFKKFGFRDYRGGGRASGRETTGRVAAGAVAKKILAKKGISVVGYSVEIAGIKAGGFDEKQIEKNSVRCPDGAAAAKMEKAILSAKARGDSVGGIVEIAARGVPPGLGEPVFAKLDAEIAKALMGIGAVKGVEFGAGFASARMRGSGCNDPMRSEKGKIVFRSNNAGGILGGISTGQDIVARIAVKPTPSISLPQETVSAEGKNSGIIIGGMHDPCICPRIVPVAEAMVALVLADALAAQEGKREK